MNNTEAKKIETTAAAGTEEQMATLPERMARLEADNENTKGWIRSISKDVCEIRKDIKGLPSVFQEAISNYQLVSGKKPEPPFPISSGTVDFLVRRILPYAIALALGGGAVKTIDSVTAPDVPVVQVRK